MARLTVEELLTGAANHSRAMQKVRRDANCADVLDRLGIGYKRVRGELQAWCINPDHENNTFGTWGMKDAPGEEKNGVARCWSCGWTGDLFHVVMMVLDCPLTVAVDFVRGGSTIEDVDPFAEIDFGEYLDAFRPWHPREIQQPPVIDIRPGSPCQRYLAGRGVGVNDISRWKLLDWPQRNRVWVPLHLDGVLISWVARTYSDGTPKVLYPKGAAQRWALFGIDQIDLSTDPRLTIAEGWLDAIRLAQAGMPNVVAAGGNRLTEQKALQMSGARGIVVWMDGDKAGVSLARDVAAWLGTNRTIEVMAMPTGTDPADFTPNELKTFEPVAWSDYNPQED